jgi:hypothetical protein
MSALCCRHRARNESNAILVMPFGGSLSGSGYIDVGDDDDIVLVVVDEGELLKLYWRWR